MRGKRDLCLDQWLQAQVAEPAFRREYEALKSSQQIARRRMGAAAQQGAFDQFPVDKIVPQYEAVYQRVVEQ